MTTDPTRAPDRPELQDVLDAYALDRPCSDSLLTWIAAHPEFETELRAYTEQWADIERLPDPDRTPDERSAEARITAANRADRMARFEAAMPGLDALTDQEASHAEAVASAEAQPQAALLESAVSLDEVIAAAGYTKGSLRKRIGLGRGTWAHLCSGMFETATEQSRDALDRIVGQIADALNVLADQVPSLFPQTPTLLQGTNYGQSRPEAGARVDVLVSLAIPDPTAHADAVRYYVTGEGSPPSELPTTT